MLCYVMLCYVMLCYVMLCYVMLCYVMLLKTIPSDRLQSLSISIYVCLRCVLNICEFTITHDYLIWLIYFSWHLSRHLAVSTSRLKKLIDSEHVSIQIYRRMFLAVAAFLRMWASLHTVVWYVCGLCAHMWEVGWLSVHVVHMRFYTHVHTACVYECAHVCVGHMHITCTPKIRRYTLDCQSAIPRILICITVPEHMSNTHLQAYDCVGVCLSEPHPHPHPSSLVLRLPFREYHITSYQKRTSPWPLRTLHCCT